MAGLSAAAGAAAGVGGVASLGFGAAFGESSGGVVDDGGAGEHAGFGDAEGAEGVFELPGLGVDGGGAAAAGAASVGQVGCRLAVLRGWRSSRLLGASSLAARSSRIVAARVVEVITLS